MPAEEYLISVHLFLYRDLDMRDRSINFAGLAQKKICLSRLLPKKPNVLLSDCWCCVSFFALCSLPLSAPHPVVLSPQSLYPSDSRQCVLHPPTWHSAQGPQGVCACVSSLHCFCLHPLTPSRRGEAGGGCSSHACVFNNLFFPFLPVIFKNDLPVPAVCLSVSFLCLCSGFAFWDSCCTILDDLNSNCVISYGLLADRTPYSLGRVRVDWEWLSKWESDPVSEWVNEWVSGQSTNEKEK